MGDLSDFVAELQYLSTENGGRQTPAFSGYRPQLKFHFSKMQTTGQQKFIDKEVANPGDTVKAKIKMLSVEFFKKSLNVGTEFEFREGNRIVGTGKITTILNHDLIKD